MYIGSIITGSILGIIGGFIIGIIATGSLGGAALVALIGCFIGSFAFGALFHGRDEAAKNKKCPQCGESVLKEAVRCKHCQSAI